MKKIFGIIGSPIKHSLSPLLHNYWLKKYNINATYSVLNIEANDLADVVKQIREKSLTGVNVTLPYKQKIINHTDQIINDAKLTGSVNTLFLDNNGLIVGENTDVFGLQAAYLKKNRSPCRKESFDYWSRWCLPISDFIIVKIRC